MQFIDVSTWERAMHYEIFRNSVQPQYCVTFDVDITNFLSYVKKRRYSFGRKAGNMAFTIHWTSLWKGCRTAFCDAIGAISSI